MDNDNSFKDPEMLVLRVMMVSGTDKAWLLCPSSPSVPPAQPVPCGQQVPSSLYLSSVWLVFTTVVASKRPWAMLREPEHGEMKEA